MATTVTGQKHEPTPAVFLLWESQRFPLRSLSPKQFVVGCESMVRRHDPNQLAPVMNGTLVSDFGEDLPVLFRVTSTDRKYARCQLAVQSDVKAKKIERLNSAWQYKLSVAASKRAELAKQEFALAEKKRAEQERMEQERTEQERAKQRKSSRKRTAAVASIPPQPATPVGAATVSSELDAGTSVPGVAVDHDPSDSTANTTSRRSGLARYALAGAIALAVGGMLFARSGNQSQTEVDSNSLSQQSLAVPQQTSTDSTPNPLPRQSLAGPKTTDSSPNPLPQQSLAGPKTTDSTPNPLPRQSLAGPNTTASTPNPLPRQSLAGPKTTDSSSNPLSRQSLAGPQQTSPGATTSRATTSRTPTSRPSRQETPKQQLRIDKLRSTLSDLKTQQAALLDQRSQMAQQQRQTQAEKLSAAKAEVADAKRSVTKIETLLQQLAPLIADENIGTAEVAKIKSDLADAKASYQSKQSALTQLRRATDLGSDSPQQSALDTINNKIRLIQQDLQQLTR